MQLSNESKIRVGYGIPRNKMETEYGEGGRELGEAGDEKLGSLASPERSQTPNKMKKSINNNNKRFSDEQIKLLESVFESESKLQPIKKMQVATQLGLQPRQVAIWFQNRRARWKSKQIEKDYKALKANYDNLASCFESLKNEKQCLASQLQNLNELMGLSSDEYGSSKDLDGGNTSTSSNHRNTNCEAEARPGQVEGAIGYSQDDMTRHNVEYFGQPGPELFGRGNYMDGSLELESPETWCIFDGANQFQQSSNCSPRLNFWS